MQTRSTLDQWTTGACEDHVLRQGIDGQTEFWWLDQLDRLLATLEAARPKRLDSKRREFRQLRGLDQFDAALSELAVAGLLVDAGLTFEFGASSKPQPDLVVTDLGVGIEVTRRRSNPIRDLEHRVRTAIEERRAHDPSFRLTPVLRFSAAVFAVRKSVQEQLVTAIMAAANNGDQCVKVEVRPEREGLPAADVEVELRYEEGGVRTEVVGALLSPKMLDIEDAIVVAMENERKMKQGAAMPSILIVDLSGVHEAWVRPDTVWRSRLAALLQPQHPYVGLATTTVDLELMRPYGLALAFNRHVQPPARAAVDPVAERLLLQVSR